MFAATLTRQVRPVVPTALRITSARSQHFLANVPLKKRGVDKVSAGDLKGKVVQNVYTEAKMINACTDGENGEILEQKFYEELSDADRKNLEVVWVSRDKEAPDQLEYYEKAMPAWCYIPFGDSNITGLLERYGVKVIPALKMVNEKGDVLSETVRADVEGCVKDDATRCYNKWKELY